MTDLQSTGSSSSSSSGSSSSYSDSESASSHSSTQSDESHHREENKFSTQNNNHLPSASDSSDEEEPPKRRKLLESRLLTQSAQVSTAVRPPSVDSTHSKHNTSPAPSVASTNSRHNGFSTATFTSRPPSVTQPSSSYVRSPSTNNCVNILTASRASSGLSIKSPELSGGSTESKSSNSSSENDSPPSTNFSQGFSNVTSTQPNYVNSNQLNGKKKTRKVKTIPKKSNMTYDMRRLEVENTRQREIGYKETETPADALERMVIDEEMLNEIKIEIKSEDEEDEHCKVESLEQIIEETYQEPKSRTNVKSRNKSNNNRIKKPNKNTRKKQENKKEQLESSSAKSSSSSSSSESESSEDESMHNNTNRVERPSTSTNLNKIRIGQRQASKDISEVDEQPQSTTLVNEEEKTNNIDALFDELKKTSPSQTNNKTVNVTSSKDAVQNKKITKNVKNSSSSNKKARMNGIRKRARPSESSENSQSSSDTDDFELAPLMTRADAEVATKVFGKRLTTQQSNDNGPCLRATRSMRAATTKKSVNGTKTDANESGSDSSATSASSDGSSVSRTGSGSKSSSGSGSDSGSASVSPSGSESESSSHSSCSSCKSEGSSLPEVRKAVRGKRVQNSNSSSIVKDETPRKLTRSRRRLQQRVDSGSDSDQAINNERLVNGERQINGNSLGIAKRPTLGLNGKSRGFLNSLLRESPPICISPPCVQEKMCPIEGCNSKGHLGGTRDRHFLPEACPLYHNMTSEECVQMLIQRRKHAENFPIPIKQDADEDDDNYGSPKRVRTNLSVSQTELWDRIQKSWREFEENPPQPKPQPEFEEGNEQREQDLTGMAPEYDLKLFRAAQAIAAEAIEDEVADCPVGKGIK